MTLPVEARTARRWIESAAGVCVLTGAGISAESGIPTFRGPDGLWRGFRAEELATPEAFAHDPETVWEWYDWRRSRIAGARPNAGHLALAELQRDFRQQAHGWTLVTQNVDGLHDLAAEAVGADQAALKLHGDIWTLRCTRCGTARIDRSVPLNPLPPICGCGGMERPGVVWFGETLPVETLRHAEQSAAACDLFLTIGTSAVVYPAAGLVRIAKSAGAKVIEINPADTPLAGMVDLAWRAPAAQALPLLRSRSAI